MTWSIIANGLVLGWSVAWPPGPINAEMIRRALLPRERGGGFTGAWQIALGACSGDFLWAFAVSVGAGAILNGVVIRRALAIVSLALLLVLAARFSVAAWKIYQTHRAADPHLAQKDASRGGFLLGFLVVLTSPWNVGFWLAVIGAQPNIANSVPQSLTMAASVVLGALAWGAVLCVAVKFGARIFARPEWQVATQALTALVMLWFAVRLLLHFP